MNKHLFYIAAACVALASCVKNEVRVNAPDKEITFQTVSTKAGGAAFDKTHKFYSYAYFLEQGKDWDHNHTDAKDYFKDALISHQNAPSGNYWAATDTYYWPKQGSLTFFAWTDDTADPKVVGTGAAVSCEKGTGIKIENYSVTDNRNKDILVADIAKDKTYNETVTGTVTGRDWTNGVPTVFRHALAKVEFKVNKKKAYENVTFKIKSITLNGVSTKGTFTQGSPTESWGWSTETPDAHPLPVFTSTTGMEVTKTAHDGKFNELTPSATDYSIVLPQNFDATSTSTLTIVYDIITTSTSFKETVTETKALNAIYTDNWKCNKNYVLKITLGLNEIFWDPYVEGWDNGTVTDIPL